MDGVAHRNLDPATSPGGWNTSPGNMGRPPQEIETPPRRQEHPGPAYGNRDRGRQGRSAETQPVDRATSVEDRGPGEQPLARPQSSDWSGSTKLLATFDGKEDWAIFFGPFQRMATQQGWSEESCINRLYERVRGPAMRFIMNLPPAIKENYPSLVEQMKQRYGKVIPPTTARQRLSEMRQGKDTPMREFGEEVRNLIT